MLTIRLVRRYNGLKREYDALMVCPHAVLINETKSRLTSDHADRMPVQLKEFPLLFPEYGERRLAGVLASLYPDPGVVSYATKKGGLVMGMGDESMDVLNPQALD